MAALTQITNPTLLDLARRLTPAGSIDTDITEAMTPTNEVLADMTWVEGNLPTGHQSTIRTGLPTATWRKLYGGVQPSKSTTTQVTDHAGELVAWAEVDKSLADLNGNTAAFRMSEEMPQLAAMNLAIAQGIFYQNETTTAASFTGLTPRYNSLTSNNAENILLADGAGTDNASIWYVNWSPSNVHGIVPRGAVAGLQRKDWGEVVIEDATGITGGSNGGGRMVAYRSSYTWKAGLVLKDWRSCVRIANIDKSNLTKTGATGSDLPDLMFQAMELVPAVCQVGARGVFYMSRTVMSFLRRQVSNKTSGSTLDYRDVGGQKIMQFHGVDVRRCDALAADETLVA